MAKGYAVGIVSETKAFKQGIQAGVIAPLEDAQDELTALGRNRGADQLGDALDDAGDAARDAERRIEDAADAVDDLGRSRGPDQLEDAMRDAQRATERLGDETEQVARDIEQEFRDTYRKVRQDAEGVGDSGVDSFGRVREGASELQSEIGGNLGEAVSSFRGDLSDLSQVGQDTFGGLAATVASMGPAGFLGALALAAGAAGLGAVTGGMEEAKDRQEELNAAAAKWADAYIESAGRIVSAAHIVAETQAIAADDTRYEDAKTAAEEWGIDVSTAMRALAGDATALATVEGALRDRAAEANRRLADQEKQVDSTAGEVYDMADSVKRGQDRLADLNEEMSLGQERARNAGRALHDYAIEAGTATGRTDALGNAIYELPDGTEIVVDAKTKRAYEDIEALERRAKKPVNGTVKFKADTRDVDNYKPKTKTGTVNYVVGKAPGGRQMV